MNWINSLIYKESFIQAIIVISIICAIGVLLGKIKIKGISFGISAVFFVGIFAGHFNITINPDMLAIAQNFGLIIFIYSLGLQVGPGFFSSLKSEGFGLNLMAIGVIIVGTILMFILHITLGISLPDMMGIFSGAVTNTPMLGAAQQAMLQIHPEEIESANNMARSCAVTYPVGIIGVILSIMLLRAILSKTNPTKKPSKESLNTYVSEFKVNNPAVFGKTIVEIKNISDKNFVISRVWKNGKVIIPTSSTLIEKEDHLLVLSNKSAVPYISTIFGERENTDWNKEDIDWNSIDSQLVSRHILITKSSLTDIKLGSLKLRNHYGINITRINRAGIDLLPSPSLRLQMGDKLTIVGEAKDIHNVGKILGNKEKDLLTPNIFAIFVGLIFGLILGTLPIKIPGITTPIMIGIAGGPIIIGILMGSFGTRFHITTYATKSANLMLQQLGITVYLAGLGLTAGNGFFAAVFTSDGLLWLGLGFLLATIPVLIVGFISSFVFKVDYAANIGMLCGSMANPMALNYANAVIETDEPSVSYATVYPLSIFLRVIIAQIIMLFFL